MSLASQLLARRRIRKRALNILRNAKYIRSMREDVLQPADLAELRRLESALASELKRGDSESVSRACEELCGLLSQVAPRRSFAGFAENFEVIVVAVAVAMGFRAYFLQPFKIPTGSMQPSLYGITSVRKTEPELMDKMPLKLAKWLVTGAWYREVTARTAGHLVPYGPPEAGESSVKFSIAGLVHRIPKDAVARNEVEMAPNRYVEAGTVLWSGIVRAGDHVFVDKLSWNFRRPRRGEIAVFGTDGIRDLPERTHYIKRLIGLPGEKVKIQPPHVVIDGNAVTGHKSIDRITHTGNGYVLPPSAATTMFLARQDQEREISQGTYFVLGDNTENSRDSRYWGLVPERNMVGRALFVYWPFSGRWGCSR